jgi:signal transduction histidine kinase
MTAGPGRASLTSLPFRLRIAVVLFVPALVAGGILVAFHAGWTAPPDHSGAIERGHLLEEWFTGQMEEARALTSAAIERGFDVRPASKEGSAIARRLEGVGQLDPGQHYLSWFGRPPEPDRWFLAPETAAWSVRLDGVNTRLLVKSEPDSEGRIALASFIIDSTLENNSFAELLPASLEDRIHLDVAFRDTRAAGAAMAGEADAPKATVADDQSVRVTLRSPARTVLAEATIHVVDPAHSARRTREVAFAWAALAFVMLAATLFRWRRVTMGGRELISTLVGVSVARLLLLVTRVPALLLPRELGSASVFGTSSLGGLAGSPADLLLTAISVYAIAVAIRDFAAGIRTSRRALAWTVAAGGTALTLAAVGWMIVCVVRNSSVHLLASPGLWRWGERQLLAVSLVLAAIGAAELLALLWCFLRGKHAIAQRRAPRVSTGVALSVVLLAGSLALQAMSQQLALERLRSEYAPLVVAQTERRSVALAAGVRHVAETFAQRGQDAVPVSSNQAFMAYHFWSSGELFFSGYQSSLAFYSPEGELVSHFGFELPALDETFDTETGEPGVLSSWEEPFGGVASVRAQLIHAEMPVFEDGKLLGTVVGHVIDEPDNLPFLPGVRPYLAALGPGAPYMSGDLPFGGPEYVLYDAPGTVLISTIDQPPAVSDALVQALDGDGSVDISTGVGRFTGMATQDPFHRLHLLLTPVPSLLQRLAASVRLLVFGVAMLTIVSALSALVRRRAAADLVRSIRGSFHAKLLAALLLASVVPLIGLALFMRGYIDQRGRESLETAAVRYAAASQRVLDDYAATLLETDIDYVNLLNDDIVDWLRNVVGQEIIVYENGLLQATSKRELFTSGALQVRLDGEVHRRLGREGLPFLVVPSQLGPSMVPVAYAPVQGADPLRELVVAVPMIAEQAEITRATDRVGEMILLSTVLLASLLAVVAAFVARTVARPLRELVGATARIAAGDYDTRLEARTRDEVADLVGGFNSMASSLATQRSDLERRRDYMERLLQHATTGVISVDPQDVVVTLNPAARALLSDGVGNVRIGETLTDTLERSDGLKPLAELISRPLRHPGEPEEIDLERDGEPRRLRVVRIDLPDPAGGSVGRLVLLDDVTELMRSNQLAAWAEMARAIAHEIKNPLTPIQLSTEHLQRLLRDRNVLPEPNVEACLDTVMKQVRTLYDIAGEFSAYAKLPALRPEPADAVAFMRAAAGPYRAAHPRNVTLEESYVPSGRAAIDGKVLGRAVVNLIENALQAMPDGGVLTVAVAPDDDRNEVVLTVADTGVGLSAEVRRRLFEPYFSTKSSGTGLGLAIARRAVEAHQGRIEVQARDGLGTAFRIHLPRVA